MIKLFKKKNAISKKDQKLLTMYERGQYLRPGEDIDNKQNILNSEVDGD